MRTDGYAPIRDYAMIGDGRTAALVALDGAIDWLCLPNLDSPSTFGALLDAERGGACVLRPSIPFDATRRYLPDTNVLETTFRTSAGVVRMVDAMTLPGARLAPSRELARVVTGVEGSVPMAWRVAPRFEYGSRVPSMTSRLGFPVACDGTSAMAVCSWDAGQPIVSDDAIQGTFETAAGREALLVLCHADGEPLVVPTRAAVTDRVANTINFWRQWAAARTYDGPWRSAVRRSALVLKLLIFAPSGASAAALTTSLPEEIGGVRNWDYRYCWVRDSNFAIDALLQLGCYDEAHALFWWFMQATALTEPELHVLYRLDGGVGAAEVSLPLAGYRGSRPVRVGNSAVEQRQLDIYGGLLETAWLFSEGHHALPRDVGAVLARVADHVCEIWPLADSGIWEVRNGPFHFTHSKVMCWVALDRAIRLAGRGELPSTHRERWKRTAAEIQRFVDTKCWSPRLASYTRTAGGECTDASLLMLPLLGYGGSGAAGKARLTSTIARVERELRQGDFVYRYLADDGVAGGEGCFLNCSFWLAGGLARLGRLDEAQTLMASLVARGNDVGLFAEQIDPRTGELLGNFPQALVHLALIDAAVALAEAAATGQAQPMHERAGRRREAVPA